MDSATPPAASPAGCVVNQLLGKTASGVPCSRLCWNSDTRTPATCTTSGHSRALPHLLCSPVTVWQGWGEYPGGAWCASRNGPTCGPPHNLIPRMAEHTPGSYWQGYARLLTPISNRTLCASPSLQDAQYCNSAGVPQSAHGASLQTLEEPCE